MADDAKNQLDGLLADYERRKKNAADAEAAKKKEVQEGLARFIAVRESVIRPALEQFVAQLKAKGYHASISQTDPGQRSDRSLPEASIAFGFGYDSPGYRASTLTFSAYGSDHIGVHEHIRPPHGGEYSGGTGTANLRVSSITAPQVDEQVLKFMQKALSEKGY